jgi:hypothetical protein
MKYLGKYRASSPSGAANLLKNNLKISDRRCIDIAGVASSILATPTIKKALVAQRVIKAFLCSVTVLLGEWSGEAPVGSQNVSRTDRDRCIICLPRSVSQQDFEMAAPNHYAMHVRSLRFHNARTARPGCARRKM